MKSHNAVLHRQTTKAVSQNNHLCLLSRLRLQQPAVSRDVEVQKGQAAEFGRDLSLGEEPPTLVDIAQARYELRDDLSIK